MELACRFVALIFVKQKNYLSFKQYMRPEKHQMLLGQQNTECGQDPGGINWILRQNKTMYSESHMS